MYKELEFKNWNELKTFLSTLNSNWVFRGQEDYSWKLRSAIDRVIFTTGIENPKSRYEKFCMYDFQRNPHLYSKDYNTENEFQILSLLQHYGIPTRLLDFSASPYVSAFFAINNCDTDAAIYAINYQELLGSTIHLFRLKYDDRSDAIVRYSQGHGISQNDIFKELVLGKTQRKFVETVQPFFLFDRMIQQNGVFLCQGDINSEFEENLSANHEVLQNMPNCSPYYKIKIDTDWKKEIIRDLFKMNITSSSLFPGIEGHLKSLKNKFEIFMEDRGSSLV